MKDSKAERARIRINAARKHLTEALEAISGPESDWVRCGAHMDMAVDVMPTVPSEVSDDGAEGAR